MCSQAGLDGEGRTARRGTHLFAAYDLGKNKPYGHVKRKPHEVPRVLPVPAQPLSAELRIVIVSGTFLPHLTTNNCRRVAEGVK